MEAQHISTYALPILQAPSLPAHYKWSC